MFRYQRHNTHELNQNGRGVKGRRAVRRKAAGVWRRIAALEVQSRQLQAVVYGFKGRTPDRQHYESWVEAADVRRSIIKLKFELSELSLWLSFGV